jgi:hypothetical protein
MAALTWLGQQDRTTAAAWFRAIADALHGLFHGDGHVTFDGEGLPLSPIPGDNLVHNLRHVTQTSP